MKVPPRFRRLCVAVATALTMMLGVGLHGAGGGQAPTGSTDPVLVGAGDVAPDCLNGVSLADAEATAQLLDATAGTVFVLGDNAYPNGTLASFNACYEPTWGRHKARTFPATGNHEYNTPGASGYFDYFNGVGAQTGQAGDRSTGYYSYNLGSWHVVVLNSECGPNGLWNVNGCAVGSAQEQWLRADLAASPTNNIIAMFHKPRFSSSWSEAAVQPLWQALYDYGADLVLNGHIHNYERLAPAGPTGARDDTYGIRQMVVGTGGVPLLATAATKLAITEVADSSAHGVLKLTLHASSYDWQFMPAAGATFTDSGTGAVHGAPPKGLVGNWQMEEGGGASLLDSSGAQNNAAVTGSPGWIPGHAGLALSLNGTTDYAVAPDRATLNPSKLTLAFWVNPSRVATQYVLKKAGAYELSLSIQGIPFFRLNGDNTYRLNAATSQTTGAWMHLAATYDGAVMRLYVNGVEQGQGLAGPAAIASSTAALGIGAQADGTSPLQGGLDDVRLYNTVLTASDIQLLATNGAPLVNAGPDQSVTLPSAASLSGSVSDDGLPNPPGGLTTSWSALSGPGVVTFANPSSASTTASFSTAGTYVVRLAASDGMLVSTDTLTVTVAGVAGSNRAPVVDAGADQAVVAPDSVALSGTVTDDGLPNPPAAVTVTWSKVSGPGAVTFADPAARSTTATFTLPGTYVLQLAASDGALTGSDTLTVTATGVVGAWKMDEGSGTQLLDASGLSNTGTLSGSPTWVPGQAGLALRLNGTTDAAMVPHQASLMPTRALTLAAWVRTSKSAPATQAVINKAVVNTTDGYELTLALGGTVFFRLNQRTSGDTYRATATTPYPLNGSGWQHVAGTYDGTTMRLYVNGQQEAALPGPASIAGNTLSVGIGAHSDGTRLFQGDLDEARIYNRALSASEIQALAAGAPPNSTNQPPVASSASVTTAEDTAVGITLAATDANGDATTYRIASQPQHGTLTGAAPTVSYKPAANYNGSDSFTFTASDATSTSNTATVSITVTPVNDAPVASNSTVASAGGATVTGQLAAADADGNALSYTLVSAPKKGTATITASTGQFTYTPTKGGKGTDSFTWRASDGKLTSNTAIVTVTLK